eukprot:scaffold957_cov402-Prasinococcus_capsulatus_cf.AAC.4
MEPVAYLVDNRYQPLHPGSCLFIHSDSEEAPCFLQPASSGLAAGQDPSIPALAPCLPPRS